MIFSATLLIFLTLLLKGIEWSKGKFPLNPIKFQKSYISGYVGYPVIKNVLKLMPIKIMKAIISRYQALGFSFLFIEATKSFL